jgi:hypothetical protein
MAKRRDPSNKEYNPLDDARGRLPIDLDLVRDVMAQPPAADTAAVYAPPPQTMPAGKGIALEKLTKYNKFLTTPTEKLELERLAARISGALGVSVRTSHLIRACLIYLLEAENDIIKVAERFERPKRPSNAEAVALAEFDQLIAELLSLGFHEAGPLKKK